MKVPDVWLYARNMSKMSPKPPKFGISPQHQNVSKYCRVSLSLKYTCSRASFTLVSWSVNLFKNFYFDFCKRSHYANAYYKPFRRSLEVFIRFKI
jgi:hypothetical protein